MSGNYDKVVELYHTFGDKEELLKVFYTDDYPIPYKKLTLYPVQVDLYYYFHLLVQCLLVPHKTSGDLKAITLSYLKYLFYLATDKKDYTNLFLLGELLLIVLKKPRTYVDKDGNKKATIEFLLGKGQFIVEGEVYDDKDFDFLRKVILEQNAIEFPDETLPPDLVKAYKEKEEYKLRQCQTKMATFEDQINVVVAKSSYKREELMTMTIRSFQRLLSRIDTIMAYEIQCLLSPYVDNKDKKNHFVHYLENTDSTLKERIEKDFTDMESLKNKIES